MTRFNRLCEPARNGYTRIRDTPQQPEAITHSFKVAIDQIPLNQQYRMPVLHLVLSKAALTGFVRSWIAQSMTSTWVSEVMMSGRLAPK